LGKDANSNTSTADTTPNADTVGSASLSTGTIGLITGLSGAVVALVAAVAVYLLRRYRHRKVILKNVAITGIDTPQALNSFIATALANLNTASLMRTHVPGQEAIYEVDFEK